ncbi:hypothetical protein HY407_04360 [Candidatus Gottesmanbacteria bacterium]|nr:hypothetical protein [Candidatus Gottesmanbacteria bacterium]
MSDVTAQEQPKGGAPAKDQNADQQAKVNQELQRREAERKAIDAQQAAVSQTIRPPDVLPPLEVSRIPLTKLGEGMLDMQSRHLLTQAQERMMGSAKELREGSWARKAFLRIPLLGALVPDVGNVASVVGRLVAPATLTMKSAVDLTGATLPAAGIAAVVGGATRFAIDGVRQTIGGEKAVHLFGRELVNRGSGNRKNLDSDWTFNTIFANKGEISQLSGLIQDFEQGMSAKVLKERLGYAQAKKLVQIGFAQNVDAHTLDTIIPKEKQSKLHLEEIDHLKKVAVGYQVSNKMFEEGFDDNEKYDFLKDLPGYFQKREWVNKGKAMLKRSLVTGFKTGLVGAGSVILKGLHTAGLLKDWVGNLYGHARAGVESIGNMGLDWIKSAAPGAANVLTDLSKGAQATVTGLSEAASQFTAAITPPPAVSDVSLGINSLPPYMRIPELANVTPPYMRVR